MEIEKLIKANEIRREIESLNGKIDSILAIRDQQVTPSFSNVGLRLEFANLSIQLDKSSFNVAREEMKFIIDYLIECWKKRKNELETEFEIL